MSAGVTFGRYVAKLFLVISLTAGAATAASDSTIEILVDASFTPSAAMGVLLHGAESVQRRDVTYTQTTHGIVVQIPFQQEQIAPGTTATAIVMSAEGETAFGQVRPVYASQDGKLPLSLPTCILKSDDKLDPSSQIALFESLVTLRSQLTENLRKQVEKELSSEVVSRISRLEDLFGLHRAVPVGMDRTPAEIADRLSRLAETVRNYRLNQESLKSAKASTQ